MSSVLIWKDSRLTADDIAPWDDTTVMFVGPKNPLSELVTDSANGRKIMQAARAT